MTQSKDGGLDLADLRRLAEKATPGPWQNQSAKQTGKRRIEANGHTVAKIWTYNSRANAAFIASFNPQTIIALLDRIATREAKP